MKLFDLIAMASANMRRNKARTLLTIIAIFIGALTITLTNGVGSGIKSYLNKQTANLGAANTLMVQIQTTSGPNQASSGPKKYDPSQKVVASQDRGPGGRQLVMSQKDLTAIKAEADVVTVGAERAISPDYIVAAQGDKYQVSTSQQFGTAKLDMTSGRPVSNSTKSPEITLPSSYVKPLGFSNDQAAIGKAVSIGISDALGQQSQISAIIVGVQQKTLIGSTTSYINTPLTDQLYSTQSQGLPEISQNQFPIVVATLKDGLTEARVTAIKNDLKSKGYSAQTTKDQVNTVFTAINAVTIVFNVFGGIALLAASFGIVNTLLMSVQERTKEIGLMKALGMSPRRIFTLFSIEAVLIGFWGSVLGVVVAELIGVAANNLASHGFLKDFTGLKLLAFPSTAIAVIVLGIMLIAFLAGTLPAVRASRKDPIEALRYE
ncbi:MAG: FtsX-like permease family protein [Candidatus Saccharibacteria bacterium]